MRLIQFLFIALVWQISSAHAQQSADYQILETVDHNSAYFTQGLELNNRVMFESSGLYKKSKIRKYHPNNAQMSYSCLPGKKTHFWFLTLKTYT